MLVTRDDLTNLMGIGGRLASGTHLNMVSEDGKLRAHVGWDDGTEFEAEVTQGGSDPARTLVTLRGVYLSDDDSFEVSGDDMSGESSDANDPLCAATTWRRLTKDMLHLA